MDDVTESLQPMGILSETTKSYIPKIGQEFDTEDDAYNYYNEYANKVGFTIRRDHSCKNRKTGEMTSRKFVCGREGFRCKDKRDIFRKYKRPETRTGCDAHMHISLVRESGKFFIKSFEEEHNHLLHQVEGTHMIRPQVSHTQGCKAKLTNEFSLTNKQMHEFMNEQVSGRGNIGCTRDPGKGCTKAMTNVDTFGDIKGDVPERYRMVCSMMLKTALRASKCAKATEILCQRMAQISLEIEDVIQSEMGDEGLSAHDSILVESNDTLGKADISVPSGLQKIDRCK